jgi:DNA-binding CsgD family transcriptional regulator
VLDLLGLDEITQAAYRVWLRDEGLTVEAVGAVLHRPPATIARSRDRLVALSLLRPVADSPDRLIAVHPEAPLEQLIQAQHEQLIRRHEHLVRARAQVSTFVSEFLASRPASGAGGADPVRIVSAENLHREITGMVGGARHEVLSVRGRSALAGLAADLLPLELRALRQGVLVRTVVGTGVVGTGVVGGAPAGAGSRASVRAGLPHVVEVLEHGGQVRLSDVSVVDLTVVDGRVGVLRLPTGPVAGPAIMIMTSDLADLAIVLFDHLWQLADPIELPDAPELVGQAAGPAAGRATGSVLGRRGSGSVFQRRPPGRPGAGDQVRPPAEVIGGGVEAGDDEAHDSAGRANAAGGADGPAADALIMAETSPTVSELLLLRLLADGSKDEAAARALGVSVRTVRRMVADLMRRLDARSRFQAGILAQRRGWL